MRAHQPCSVHDGKVFCATGDVGSWWVGLAILGGVLAVAAVAAFYYQCCVTRVENERAAPLLAADQTSTRAMAGDGASSRSITSAGSFRAQDTITVNMQTELTPAEQMEAQVMGFALRN